MKKLRHIFLLILVFYTCSNNKAVTDNYLKDSTLTDFKGYPKAEYPIYFPDSIRTDSIYSRTNLNSFVKSWYSSTLYASGSPILFNYYLGHPMYRFIWLRSFDPPVIFTIHKDKGNVWIETKMLTDQVEFWHYIYTDKHEYRVDPLQDSSLTRWEGKSDSIKKAKWNGEIKIEKRAELTIKDWKEFEEMVTKYSFWNMTPSRDQGGVDGSEYIIEGHSKNKYWMVYRWSPRDSIRDMGEFLIKKSGVNFESKGP